MYRSASAWPLACFWGFFRSLFPGWAFFDSVSQAGLVLLNVPFALVGGVAALWLRGLNLNLSGSIGFIALFGIARTQPYAGQGGMANEGKQSIWVEEFIRLPRGYAPRNDWLKKFQPT